MENVALLLHRDRIGDARAPLLVLEARARAGEDGRVKVDRAAAPCTPGAPFTYDVRMGGVQRVSAAFTFDVRMGGV